MKILPRYISEVPYSAFSAALRKKDVIVNGLRIGENVFVHSGSEITVFTTDNAVKNDFSVFYEDENILIVDKCRGIEVCDGEYNIATKLLDAGKKVLPVHRLDRNTSGLVMFAKSAEAHDCFKAALQEGRIRKFYTAEVYGVPSKKNGILTDYIVKYPKDSIVKVFSSPVAGSVKAVTKYSLVKQNGDTSLLLVEIHEGKTHQIRACLAYHGLPIIGDGKYGDARVNRRFHEKYQRLTACKLLFDFAPDTLLFYLNTMDVSIDAKF